MNKFNLNREQIEELTEYLFTFIKRVSYRETEHGEAKVLPEIVKLLLDIPHTENLFVDFEEDNREGKVCESENLQKLPISGHCRTCECACCRCFIRE